MILNGTCLRTIYSNHSLANSLGVYNRPTQWPRFSRCQEGVRLFKNLSTHLWYRRQENLQTVKLRHPFSDKELLETSSKIR